MKFLLVIAAILCYLGFMSLIAFAVWYTGSAWALLGLLLWPGLKFKTE